MVRDVSTISLNDALKRHWVPSVWTCQTDSVSQAHPFILAFVLRASNAPFSACAELCCVRTAGYSDGWLEIHSLCPMTKQSDHYMTQWMDSHFSSWEGSKGSFLFKQGQALKWLRQKETRPSKTCYFSIHFAAKMKSQLMDSLGQLWNESA